MNVLNIIKEFIINNKVYIASGFGIALVIAFIITFILIRKKIYKYMAEAEAGALSYSALAKTVDKIQQSDLDERMVLVIAKIITSFPLLKLLPTSLVAKYLNGLVQKAFDKVKLLLKAKAENVAKDKEKYYFNKKEVDTIVSNVMDQVDNLIKMKYGSLDNMEGVVIDIIKKNKSINELADTVDSSVNVLINNTDIKVPKIEEISVDTVAEAVSEVLPTSEDLTNNIENVVDDIDKIATLFTR